MKGDEVRLLADSGCRKPSPRLDEQTLAEVNKQYALGELSSVE
jgi:hypothetical protein